MDEFDDIPKPPPVHQLFPDVVLCGHTERVAAEGGDCLAMCLSFITGLPREAIPNFIGFGECIWWERFNSWLSGWGMKLIRADDSSDSGHVICVGQDKRDAHHAVVHVGGKLAYDPWPAGGGIEYVEYRWRVVIDE
jgi:hypothetical protein